MARKRTRSDLTGPPRNPLRGLNVNPIKALKASQKGGIKPLFPRATLKALNRGPGGMRSLSGIVGRR